ncbi:D-alanyl-D-alanine carboxypeptidase/D-alanyl-D-alanine-endopeptidase [Candidatus Dependentiae bacterium]|nr:D-alanyl-D-alanine carboxypeptidase/D-alanyl-D-alanine-endopeptidase [Candidatus Dependentiae bacterium]
MKSSNLFNNILARTVFISFLLSAFSLNSVSPEQKTYIKQSIKSLINNVDPNAHIGVEIVSLRDHECIYQKNRDQLFIPASVLKLFTATAALTYLGKDYRFITQILSDAPVTDGIVHGSLYIKGSGDPSLETKDIVQLVSNLKELGINEIHGDIVVDTSEFDTMHFGPGWMWDEGAASFNAPIDALTVNHNCVKVTVSPSHLGAAPLVVLTPSTNYMGIDNQALTSEIDGSPALRIARRWLARENVIDITGSVELESVPKQGEYTVEKPALYAATLFKELLAQASIVFRGTILKDRPVAKNAHILASHASEPLENLLKTMLKNSDNLYAECLFKKLGKIATEERGSWQTGKKALQGFFENVLGITTDRYVVVDGSGFSRYNLISPHQLVMLLDYIAKDALLLGQLTPLLPLAGVDGTLKDRLKEGPACRNVQAKTGTMTGVSALAGFMCTKSREPLAFAVMINGVTKPVREYKLLLEDQICTLLADLE